jgi:hypothetical protein
MSSKLCFATETSKQSFRASCRAPSATHFVATALYRRNTPPFIGEC